MRLRAAGKEDFPAICELFTHNQELFWIYPRAQFPFTIEQLQELYASRSDFTVAVEENRIIGFVNLYNIVPQQYAFIGNVVVNASQRGKGTGRKLVNHMLGLIYNKYALPEARIAVFSENTKAMLLYASLGFVPYAIEERKDFSGKRVALVYLKRFACASESSSF